MEKQVSTYIEEYLEMELTEALKEQLSHYVQRVTFAKNAIVIKAEERSDAIYLIVKGIVRGYYLDQDGNEITKCFSGNNQVFGSEGLRTGKLATFFVECITECECIRIPYSLLKTLMKDNPMLKERIQRLYLDEISWLENRAKEGVMYSAKERYLAFYKQYAGLAEQIPLKYIASYLGINPGSLSRIRANLKK